MSNIFSLLPVIIMAVPLFLVMGTGVIYAIFKRPELGLPATLVIIGGTMLMIAQAAASTMTVMMINFREQLGMSFETISMLNVSVSVLNIILNCVGWGLILWAVFAGREQGS